MADARHDALDATVVITVNNITVEVGESLGVEPAGHTRFISRLQANCGTIIHFLIFVTLGICRGN